MDGPIADVVRFGLLVLFLWAQQRIRPRRYLRYWLAGWISVFCSYVVWGWGGLTPLGLEVQDALGFNFMLGGVLAFLLAMLPSWRRARKMMLVGAVIGVMGVLTIDALAFGAVPKWLLVVMILAWQGDGMYMATRLLKGKLERTWKIILAICILYGFGMVLYVTMSSAKNLNSWAAAEVLLCTAALNWEWGERRSVARWVGTAGLVTWAAFYFADIALLHPTPARRLLDEFWSFPKYAVAATMILKIFEDATAEQTRMADKFRELYDDFRLIYDTHPHPMWICDEESHRFLTANEATHKVYGYSMEELKEMRLAELEAPGDAEAEDVRSTLEAPAQGTRIQHRHKDGRVVWVNVVERQIMYLGREARFVISYDITEQMRQDLKLEHRAHHDVLTGLPNRQLLSDRLDQCLIASERDQRRAAILTIDIDHFKMINDTYGHLVGDECLQQVAERLKSKIRKVDTIARTGGEEFMAVVSGLNNVLDSEKVAASLLRVFEAPLELTIGQIGVTVSIGVAVYPDDAKDAETLRRLSDEALYRAKRGGRNRAEYAFELHARHYAI